MSERLSGTGAGEILPRFVRGRFLKFMISELQALFEYYEKEKGIDRPKMVEALQSALLAASKRSIGPARELRIDIDPEKGSIRAFAKLLVTETVSNPFEEISLANANRLRKGALIGEEVDVEVTPKDFGCIAGSDQIAVGHVAILPPKHKKHNAASRSASVPLPEHTAQRRLAEQ